MDCGWEEGGHRSENTVSHDIWKFSEISLQGCGVGKKEINLQGNFSAKKFPCTEISLHGEGLQGNFSVRKFPHTKISLHTGYKEISLHWNVLAGEEGLQGHKEISFWPSPPPRLSPQSELRLIMIRWPVSVGPNLIQIHRQNSALAPGEKRSGRGLFAHALSSFSPLSERAVVTSSTLIRTLLWGGVVCSFSFDQFIFDR